MPNSLKLSWPCYCVAMNLQYIWFIFCISLDIIYTCKTFWILLFPLWWSKETEICLHLPPDFMFYFFFPCSVSCATHFLLLILRWWLSFDIFFVSSRHPSPVLRLQIRHSFRLQRCLAEWKGKALYHFLHFFINRSWVFNWLDVVAFIFCTSHSDRSSAVVQITDLHQINL